MSDCLSVCKGITAIYYRTLSYPPLSVHKQKNDNLWHKALGFYMNLKMSATVGFYFLSLLTIIWLYTQFIFLNHLEAHGEAMHGLINDSWIYLKYSF